MGFPDWKPSLHQDEILYRVTTRGFVAAVIVRDGMVVQAAPILRRYVGMHWRKAKYEIGRGKRIGEFDIENLSGGNDHDDEDTKDDA